MASESKVRRMAAARVNGNRASNVGLRSERNGGGTNVVDDIQNTISNTLSDPAFLLTAIMSAAIVMTHMDDPLKGPFGQFFASQSSNTIVAWLFANFSKVCGLLVMSPTAFRAARHLRNVVFVAVAAAIIALPAYPLWYYVVVSVALHLYLHVRSARTRTVVLALVGVYTYFVYEHLKKHVPLNYSYLLNGGGGAVATAPPVRGSTVANPSAASGVNYPVSG